MVWFLLLLMATACAACVNNLEHGMFVFPRKSNVDHVKVDSSIHTFIAATVCLRVKTDLCRDHVIFSLSIHQQSDTFVIFRDHDNEVFEVEINGHTVHFKGFEYKPNKWHSICVTWDATSGLTQLWINKDSSVRKFVGGVSFSNPCIILGQEQDDYCCGFDQHQSFVGLITDFNMWDYILNPCEIQSYMEYERICSGNAVNWSNLSFHISGKVSVQDRPICAKERFLKEIMSKHTHVSKS